MTEVLGRFLGVGEGFINNDGTGISRSRLRIARASCSTRSSTAPARRADRASRRLRRKFVLQDVNDTLLPCDIGNDGLRGADLELIRFDLELRSLRIVEFQLH
jgi:hypothetical protein